MLEPSGLHHFKKETPTQMFSCEFCEIFKDTFLIEHLGTTASEIRRTSFFFLFLLTNLFWRTQFPEFYNYLKEHRFYFATICVESFVYCIS